MTEPKWLELAREQLGEHEVDGAHDNPEIIAFYKDSGHPEIKHDEVAWCAAFTGAMLERAGVPSAKTLSARDYLTWGKKLDRPQPGCVCVFSRGDPRGYTGHVGFYVGEQNGQIELLGGNQADSVSITHMPKSRLLGYRWPVTATTSRTYKAVGVGSVGTALVTLAPSAPSLISMGGEFKALGGASTVFAFIGAALCILAFIAIIYARQDDAAVKGR
jgi:uncharacterized protein (TIGR02594 family)